MPKYNYQNLSPEEFESLACDIMSRKLRVQLYRFATGPDGGIDLTDDVKKHGIVVQCKRYQDSSDLMSSLKNERKKIEVLTPKPEKYYLFTSVELSVKRKQEILDLFGGFMQSEQNIIDAIEIEEFFKSTGNMDIVSKHKNLFEAYPDIYVNEYLNSFREYVDSWRPLLEVDETYHYRNQYLQCIGREKEFAVLEEFLQCQGILRWMGVVGPGGMGKSKMLYAFMHKMHENPDWKTIWIPYSDIYEVTNTNYTRWSYPKNLLIVIDYAGREAESIGKWIVKMYRRIDAECTFKKKVRIVLIEREDVISYNNVFMEPVWYKRLQGYSDQKHYINHLLYRVDEFRPFLQVYGLEKEYNISLVKNYLATKGISLGDEQVEKILIKSQAIDNEFDIPRPLFILLTVDAMLEKKEMLHWRYSDVMIYVLNRQEQHWLTIICKKNNDVLAAVKRVLLYATACSFWQCDQSLRGIFKEPSDKLRSLGNNELQEIIYSLNRQEHPGTEILTTNQNRALKLNALEPDLIGEYYVLTELKDLIGEAVRKDAIQVLWEREKEFYEFLYRCCETYYDEEHFTYFFKDGFSLLEPNVNGNERLYLYSRLLSYLGKKYVWLSTKKQINHNLYNIWNSNPSDLRIAREYADTLFSVIAESEYTDRAEYIESLRNVYETLKNTDFPEQYFGYLAGISGTFSDTEWQQYIEDINSFLNIHDVNESVVSSYLQAARNRIAVCNDDERQKLLKYIQNQTNMFDQDTVQRNLFLEIFVIAFRYGDEKTKKQVIKNIYGIQNKRIFQNADKELQNQLIDYLKGYKVSLFGLSIQKIKDAEEKPETLNPSLDKFGPGWILNNGEKYVFISYSHKDFERVEPYIRLLQKKGIHVLFDRNTLLAGEGWGEQIAEVIDKCEVLCCFMSKNSIQSEWFNREMLYAIHGDKKVIVVYLEETELTPKMEMLGSSRRPLIYAYRYYQGGIDFEHTTLAERFYETCSRYLDKY